MKKVKLSRYKIPEKSSIITANRKYQVYLGNGLNVLFTNEKEVKKFLLETNRFLTDKLFEINDYRSKLLQLYCLLWFYMVQYKNFKFDSSRLINEFTHLDRIMSLAANRGSYINGNYMVFKHLNSCLDILTYIAEQIDHVYKSKRNFLDSTHIAILIHRIEVTREDIKSYGFDKYDHVPLKKMGIQFSYQRSSGSSEK